MMIVPRAADGEAHRSRAVALGRSSPRRCLPLSQLANIFGIENP